ncbi:helix-turn-helix domain-containing protein [Ectobacillus funiculus]|uniref:helix-turn-helix domain-containing protein n=1 Tax=Ectobacillus funiculus TaxID=137993 RepID=UPI00101DC9D7|nr:helix-turn-helix domain-containing protein [Ectobacillus funiculus]
MIEEKIVVYLPNGLQARIAKEFVHKAAALYLSNSELPIPDIAEEVGYSSLSFFYKKFNEIFFQTPKEYRDDKH